MKIKLEPYNPLVFFHGTEEQAENAERKRERNAAKIRTVFELVNSGKVDAAYVTGSPNKNTRMYLVHIVHRSAKYDHLQMTTALYESGSFKYFLSDTEIETAERLYSEFPHNDKVISIK